MSLMTRIREPIVNDTQGTIITSTVIFSPWDACFWACSEAK